MTDRFDFRGTIIRLEKEGFGIVEFDQALGANTYGVFSTTISEPGTPFGKLKRGDHVAGIAEVDDRELAAVKTLRIEPAQ